MRELGAELGAERWYEAAGDEQQDTGRKYEARSEEESVTKEGGEGANDTIKGERGKRGRTSTRRKGRCRRREVVSRRVDEGEWGKSGRAQHKGMTKEYSPRRCSLPSSMVVARTLPDVEAVNKAYSTVLTAQCAHTEGRAPTRFLWPMTGVA